MKSSKYQDALIETFKEQYPDPKSELNFKNEFELVISVVLSAQCTDKKVNAVTPELFGNYPTFGTLAKGKVEQVEKILRSINYYRTKARNIIELSKQVVSDFHGNLPTTFDELTSLPGVGQKTANVVLGEQGLLETFPVDTHVFRVSKRLGLASANTAVKVEEQLKSIFKPNYWRPMHHWLILHGRKFCKARTPLCEQCKLNQICPSSLTKN